jgi:eukaryotic-like serine/threonine-protein kinase
MNERSASPVPLAFGAFEWDPANRELRKGGVRMRLSGQPLQVLEALLEQPNQTVSRDQLRRRLWTDDGTFVDFEQGLNTAVNKLRLTLGDQAERPRFIETVPGRGYRFVAVVQPVQADGVGGVAAEPSRAVSRRTALWWGGSLTLAAAGGYFAGRLPSWPSPSMARPTRFRVYPPEGYWLESAATRQGFALSPDGTRLVFTAKGPDGRFRAWRRDLADVDPHHLPQANDAQTVFWEPAGDQLYWLTRGALRKGPPAGPYTLLADTGEWLIAGADLGSWGVVVHANRLTTFRVPAGGGDPQRLAASCAWPESLPGGRVLFVDFGPSPGVNMVRVSRARAADGGFELSPPSDPIVETNSKARYVSSAGPHPERGYLVYVRAGSLMAHPFDPASLRVTGEALPIVNGVTHVATPGAADFSVGRNVLAYQPFLGRAQLTWVDRTGRALGTVGPANAGIYHVRLSHDASRIAVELYDVESGSPFVWIFNGAGGAGEPRDLFAFMSVWGPASHRIAYAGLVGSPARGLPKVFVKGAMDDAVGERVLPAAPVNQLQWPVDWSRDGRLLFYRTPFDGNIHVIDFARDGRSTPILEGSAIESDAALSPRGRWLAFISDRRGRPEVYLQAFSADPAPHLLGEHVQVSRNGALSVRWGVDGRELFYAGADGRLYAAAVSLSGQVASPAPLFDIEIDAVEPHAEPFTFDVHPDGRLLVPRITNPERDHLVVVENWEALLA